MSRRTWVARLFTAAVAAVAAVGTAGAGIIPASVTVTPEAGNFRWQYSIVLPTDMKLQAGDYFTIYDFGGIAFSASYRKGNFLRKAGRLAGGKLPSRQLPKKPAHALIFLFSGS